MKFDQSFLDELSRKAMASPRLRMHYDLRDSADENGQRMMNVLLPGTKSAIHRHTNTSEVVICIQGSCIDRLYDDNGNETECITLTAGGEVPGLVIPTGVYHSLEATDAMSVIVEAKAGKYDPVKTEEFL